MVEGGMEGERKGNRGAHSAGGKSALFIFSSLQPLSFSLWPCLPQPVISIYHQAQALLSSFSFTLCVTLPLASLHLSPCRPLRSPSPPTFTAAVFHRRFRKSQPLPSIYEIAHVISWPPQPPQTHPCAQLSLISLSGCILSLRR